jgi:hypothetical protein
MSQMARTRQKYVGVMPLRGMAVVRKRIKLKPIVGEKESNKTLLGTVFCDYQV